MYGRTVNTFGIDRDTLTSVNALIPIAYYLFGHSGRTLLGSTPTDVLNAARVRRWLVAALLNNTFGRAGDTVLTEARHVLEQHSADADFPADPLARRLAPASAFADQPGTNVAAFLDIQYGRRETFLALSLLYDETNWGLTQYHVDHIFPRALFSHQKLTALGLDLAARDRLRELENRVGNLELLSARENVVKSSQDFAAWLATRDDGFKRRHLIPNEPALLKLENFEGFIAAREELIRARLGEVFADGAVALESEGLALAG